MKLLLTATAIFLASAANAQPDLPAGVDFNNGLPVGPGGNPALIPTAEQGAIPRTSLGVPKAKLAELGIWKRSADLPAGVDLNNGLLVGPGGNPALIPTSEQGAIPRSILGVPLANAPPGVRLIKRSAEPSVVNLNSGLLVGPGGNPALIPTTLQGAIPRTSLGVPLGVTRISPIPLLRGRIYKREAEPSSPLLLRGALLAPGVNLNNGLLVGPGGNPDLIPTTLQGAVPRDYLTGAPLVQVPAIVY